MLIWFSWQTSLEINVVFRISCRSSTWRPRDPKSWSLFRPSPPRMKKLRASVDSKRHLRIIKKKSIAIFHFTRLFFQSKLKVLNILDWLKPVGPLHSMNTIWVIQHRIHFLVLKMCKNLVGFFITIFQAIHLFEFG